MSKLELLPERALDLASQAGDAIRGFAPRANEWLDAGAKLGALKTGAKVGMMVVRRNPLIFVATAAGAGLLWYAAKRRARRAENGEGQTVEGSARRIEARRAKAKNTEAGETTARKTRSRSGTRRAARSRSASSTENRTEH